ncbi:alpha/beta hydrolase family protein [Nonomuraea sp. NPDC004354]
MARNPRNAPSTPAPASTSISSTIAILAPNFAGSTHYGTAHQKLIYCDGGGIDLDDLDHAVQHLYTLDWADPNRLAVMGASYGGFAALSCLARLPYPWAASVSMCGPSNLLTLAKASPPTWKTFVATVLGDPDTRAEHLLERSPVTHADGITAPLFVIQGAHYRSPHSEPRHSKILTDPARRRSQRSTIPARPAAPQPQRPCATKTGRVMADTHKPRLTSSPG